jgi:hypothetical protein
LIEVYEICRGAVMEGDASMASDQGLTEFYCS